MKPTGPSPAPPWQRPPKRLTLEGRELDVWRVPQQVSTSGARRLAGLLSVDELQTADRFHFPLHRARFIVRRGTLRGILGRYLGIPGDRVVFRYGRYGKPELAEEFRASGLRFNTSHSRDLALFAVARGRDVGIDVERIRRDLACREIAQRFFSLQEGRVIEALPKSDQFKAFFKYWTRKEAFAKALGHGLRLRLDRVDFSGNERTPIALQWKERHPLTLYDLDRCSGFAAAFVVAGQGASARFLRWTEWS